MPRRRTRSDNKLPNYVRLSKGRFVWRQYLGRENGRSLYAKELVLGPGTLTVAQVWDAYNRMADKGPTTGTIQWLVDRFLASAKFDRLAERTQEDYRKYRDAMCNRPSRAGRFGDVELRTVTTRTVNTYLSTSEAPVQANRQVAMLSSAWKWIAGEERIPPNPVPGCRWNPEKARSRYVEDSEFEAVKEEAGPNLRVALEIIYLCRLRKCEALDLETEQDLRFDGLLARRRKGSKTQIVELSERLDKAIQDAKALHGDVVRKNLLVTKNFTPYTTNGLPSSLRGACKRAIKKGKIKKAICLHDLKRKGVSDFEGTETEKLDSAGHRDRRTAGIYNVKPSKTRSTR